jgi:hypothetical protein
VQIRPVIVGNPDFQGRDQLKWAGPFRERQALFFQGVHHPLRLGVPCRIVTARIGLRDTQSLAGPHKGYGGRLAPVVAHQRQVLAANACRELAIDGPIQGHEPMLGLTMHPSIVAHDRLGLPTEDHDDIHPANAFDRHLGHLDALPLRGLVGFGWRPVGVRFAVSRGFGSTSR